MIDEKSSHMIDGCNSQLPKIWISKAILKLYSLPKHWRNYANNLKTTFLPRNLTKIQLMRDITQKLTMAESEAISPKLRAELQIFTVNNTSTNKTEQYLQKYSLK